MTIGPTTPRLNSTVERFPTGSTARSSTGSWKATSEDNVGLFNGRLLQWEHYYDYDGPPAPAVGRPPKNASTGQPTTRCHTPPSLSNPRD